MISRMAGVCAFALFVIAVRVDAAPITFTASGDSRSASVTFEEGADSTLIVRLKNTSLSDVGVPNQVLTAVFFSVAGNPALTPSSAVLGAGSSVLFGGAGAGGEVGGEWAYRNSITGLNPYGANTGISSTGLDVFGAGDRFPGANLSGPEAPDGLQYGIVSAGDDPTVGNAKVTGSTPLIKNEVVFTLGNWLLGDPTPHISNVTFQYGTDFSEPHLPGRSTTFVAEPATLLLFVAAGVAARHRIRRRSSTTTTKAPCFDGC